MELRHLITLKTIVEKEGLNILVMLNPLLQPILKNWRKR